MKYLPRMLALALLTLAALAAHADGFIELEAGVAFTGYNDVQIPSDTGTRLSLADDTNSEPALALRVRAGYTFADRHTVMFLAAPLTVRGTGTLNREVTTLMLYSPLAPRWSPPTALTRTGLPTSTPSWTTSPLPWQQGLPARFAVPT
jgi:hypothetical protein